MPVWNFTNQVVLITGGAGGLGMELCRAFLNAGAIVYTIDNREEKIRSQEIHIEQVDVTKVEELRQWVQRVTDVEGKVDILINAAGVTYTAAVAEVTEVMWDEVVDVNLKGAFFASQAVAEWMKKQQYGRIINVGSVGGFTGGAIVTPPYVAAKAGLVALSKSLAQALSPYGVCVNTVAPGPFETDMIADFPKETMEKIRLATPNRRVGQPVDVVQAILFLADATSLHITGATLDVNGGLYMR
jgi:NAD(P)-dependent dehydrogenase (short-subunit alcohol dehydrogenase family)